MSHKQNFADYAVVEQQIRAARVQRAVYLAETFATLAEKVVLAARRVTERLANQSPRARTRRPA